MSLTYVNLTLGIDRPHLTLDEALRLTLSLPGEVRVVDTDGVVVAEGAPGEVRLCDANGLPFPRTFQSRGVRRARALPGA